MFFLYTHVSVFREASVVVQLKKNMCNDLKTTHFLSDLFFTEVEAQVSLSVLSGRLFEGTTINTNTVDL